MTKGHIDGVAPSMNGHIHLKCQSVFILHVKILVVADSHMA